MSSQPHQTQAGAGRLQVAGPVQGTVERHRAAPEGDGSVDGRNGGAASAGRGPVRGGNYRTSPAWRVFNAITELIDRRVGWDRLPTPLGLAVLVGVRNVLRQHNLHDTERRARRSTCRRCRRRARVPHRSAAPTARYNDLDAPGDGHGRVALRPQHPARTSVAAGEPGAVLEPEPARRSAASC